MTGPQGRRPAGPARGLLRAAHATKTGDHRRVLPSASLAPYVAHFWWVRWQVPEPTTVETLPHPCVHIVFEGPRAEIAGVCTERFTRRLAGEGSVFGIKLRPATFCALRRGSVSELTDRVVPVDAVLGQAGQALGQRLLATPDLDEKIALAESFLEARLAPLPEEAQQLRDLVERVAVDPALIRVERLAELLDLDLRTLQRRFRKYVGVSPKWTIQRYRLHEAAEQLRQPHPKPLAVLAAELGYADQAHFARDFKRVVGQPPGRFKDDPGEGPPSAPGTPR